MFGQQDFVYHCSALARPPPPFLLLDGFIVTSLTSVSIHDVYVCKLLHRGPNCLESVVGWSRARGADPGSAAQQLLFQPLCPRPSAPTLNFDCRPLAILTPRPPPHPQPRPPPSVCLFLSVCVSVFLFSFFFVLFQKTKKKKRNACEALTL